MDCLLKGISRRGSDDEFDGNLNLDDIQADDDHDFDESAHDILLDSIGQTVGAKVKRKDASRRAETRISEFDTIADDRGPLPAFRGVKEVRKAKKAKKKKAKIGEEEEIDEEDLYDEVYDDPSVTKPVFEKQKRTALYEHTKKEVSKWNSVVYHNRNAEQLVFPLGAGEKISKRSIKDAADEFVPETPLEVEMAKILHGEEYVKKKQAKLHTLGEVKSAEEQYQLSVEEALERHNEMARLRAIQSYEMAKARRQNKIKSKKYHRLLRREKIKNQLKEFEDLKQTNPEAALEKLEELERARVKERMTLKHRNTSKWSKMHAARAKYDKDSRMALAEQLKISKDLTAKLAESSDEESMDEDEEEDNSAKKQKDGDAYEIRNLAVNTESVLSEVCLGKRPNAAPVLNLLSARERATPAAPVSAPAARPNPAVIDPSKYLHITAKQTAKAKEITVDPELLKEGEDDEDEDDEDDQRMIIAEAFEDDDVVPDFQKKKSEEVEASKPKDVDLFLPGWGAWGGKGVNPSKAKREKFIKKAPPQPPRRDDNLKHVIINEEANKKIRDHMVKHLPYPFKRVQDFEKIIRAPIGRTWMPERAMKDLIKPKIITKSGSVIKPISEDVLVKKKGDINLKNERPTVKLLRV